MPDQLPQIKFPVLKNGQVVPGSIADGTAPAAAAPVQQGPKINLPKLAQVDPEQARRVARAAVMQAHPVLQPALEALRSATFGLSDRALALLHGGDYTKNLNDIQSDRDQYRQEHPVLSTVQDLAGGLATGGAVSSSLKAAGAKVLPQVANYAQKVGLLPGLTRLGQVAGEGAIIGEAAHQGEQGPGQVGHNFGQGAGLGALLGVGGVGLSKVASAGYDALSGYGQKMALAARLASPEKFANKAFVQSLKDQKLTPEEVESTMKFLRGDDIQLQGPQPNGKPLPNSNLPIITADALPKGTLGMVKRALKKNDEAVTNVSNTLTNRSEEQGMRLQNHITTAISPDINATADQQALQEARKAASDPLYKQAYAAGTVNDPALDEWLAKRPVSAQMFSALQKNRVKNGEPMTAKLNVQPDGTFAWDTRPTVEDLDTMKKHLDAKINKLWNPSKNSFDLPSNVEDSDAYQLMDNRNDLVNLINKVTPDGKGGSYYDQARKAFADNTELMDAHKAGQSIIRTRPEDVHMQYDAFQNNPELQDQYRAGISSALSDMLDKNNMTGNAAILRKIYGTPGMQSKLNYVMGDPSTKQYFNRSMAGETAMANTQKELTPRAVGTDVLDGEGDFSLPLAAMHAMSGRFGSALNQLGRAGTNAIGGIAPEVGEHLAEIATMSPEQFAAWNAARKAAENTPSAKAAKILGGLGQYVANGVPAALSNEAGQSADSFAPSNLYSPDIDQ